MRSLLILALTLCGLTVHAQQGVKPNIVFLLVDDLRWNALGCMGDKIVKTPNIDKLAANGVLFRNAFVTTSICWASRASIFTGQWMRRHGVGMGKKEDFKPGAWPQTYPAIMKANGYRTGFIGKFGVGDAKQIAAHQADFDYWRGLPGQAGMFFEKDDPTHTHKTARFGNEALEFLRDCQAGKPFCLSLSFNAVHARDHQPREYPPDIRDEGLYDGIDIPLPKLATDEAFKRLPEAVQKSEGRTRYGWRFDEPQKAQAILHDYYALITGVDREVGRIREALQAQGLADNTLIFFTGDNGYALADRGMADKWYAYEEDLRVPLIIFDPRLPGNRRGQQETNMVLNVDLAPTLLDLCGFKAPPVMQGRSLKPIIEGHPPSDWRTEFFYEHYSVPDRIPPVEAVRTERFKYIRWMEPNPVVEELYDLQNDPLEEHDLFHDPGQAELVKSLQAKRLGYGQKLQ